MAQGRSGFIHLRPAPAPRSPREKGGLCSRFVLAFRLNTEAGSPATRLGATAGKAGKSKPQLPDLSELRAQEENKHEGQRGAVTAERSQEDGAAGSTLARPWLALGLPLARPRAYGRSAAPR